MSITVPVAEFVAHFEDFQVRLSHGESFTLCVNGKPVGEVSPPARMVSVARPPAGAFKSVIGDLSEFHSLDQELIRSCESALG